MQEFRRIQDLRFTAQDLVCRAPGLGCRALSVRSGALYPKP